MQLIPNEYYHIYYRTNNNEALFRSRENYAFFLKKYRYYTESFFDTVAYCLMPTHFHFLVKVKEPHKDIQIELFNYTIGNSLRIMQTSYTRAYNNRYERHGSLFQQHIKTKIIDHDKSLIKIAAYIHQNPVRSQLCSKQEEWEFSSYLDYSGSRNGTLPRKHLILKDEGLKEFIAISKNMIANDPI